MNAWDGVMDGRDGVMDARDRVTDTGYRVTDAWGNVMDGRDRVEGANGPTTPAADEILRDRDIIVVLDILPNAGGLVVSCFECMQDLQFFFWDEEEVNRNLRRIMVNSFKNVWDYSRQQELPLRMGAYMLAVEKVAGAIHDRGVFP